MKKALFVLLASVGFIIGFSSGLSAQVNLLHEFMPSNDGLNPDYGHLINVGTYCYGMTPLGGDYDRGTVFKINPEGSGYALLHSFAGDGGYPFGSLLESGGALYDGIGDFDGDGKTDILWRNTGWGEVGIWLMDGTSHVGDASIGVVDLIWKLVKI